MTGHNISEKKVQTVINLFQEKLINIPVDKGSSFLPGEINAAFIRSTWEIKKPNKQKIKRSGKSIALFSKVKEAFNLQLQVLPSYNSHNAHMPSMYCLKTKKRNDFMNLAFQMGVNCVFHYIRTLFTCRKIRKTFGNMSVTDSISSRLLRMPYRLNRNTKKIFIYLRKYFNRFNLAIMFVFSLMIQKKCLF